MEDDPGVAAVRAAGEEDDVGVDGLELGQVLGGELVGEGPDDLAAGRGRGHAGDRKGQVGGQADRGDLEPASGRGGPIDGDVRGGGSPARGIGIVSPNVPGENGLADPGEAAAEVVDRRRNDLTAGGAELLSFQEEQSSLGVGRPDIDGEEERSGHQRSRPGLEVLAQRSDDVGQVDLGREDPVEAHGLELPLDLLERGLADDEVAADVEEDPVEAALDGLLSQALAVDQAVAVEGGDEDGPGVGLDGGVEELVLADHDAQVDDVEAGLGEVGVEDLVADRMAVGPDDAQDDARGVHQRPRRPSSRSVLRRSSTVEEGAPLDLVVEGDDDPAPLGELLDGGQVLAVPLQRIAGRDDDGVEAGDEVVEPVDLGPEERRDGRGRDVEGLEVVEDDLQEAPRFADDADLLRRGQPGQGDDGAPGRGHGHLDELRPQLGEALQDLLEVGRRRQDEVEALQALGPGRVLEDVVDEDLGHVDVGDDEELALEDGQGFGVAVDGRHVQVLQLVLAPEEAQVEEDADVVGA